MLPVESRRETSFRRQELLTQRKRWPWDGGGVGINRRIERRDPAARIQAKTAAKSKSLNYRSIPLLCVTP
jgi:hypothetical protein